jgi:hypothetical protein
MDRFITCPQCAHPFRARYQVEPHYVRPAIFLRCPQCRKLVPNPGPSELPWYLPPDAYVSCRVISEEETGRGAALKSLAYPAMACSWSFVAPAWRLVAPARWLLRECALWVGDLFFWVCFQWFKPWGLVHRAYELDPDGRRWLVGFVSLIGLLGLFIAYAFVMAMLF